MSYIIRWQINTVMEFLSSIIDTSCVNSIIKK